MSEPSEPSSHVTPIKPLPNAAVAAALRALLPTAGQTLLLAAALDHTMGAQAWSTWCATHQLQETLASDRMGVKGLLPLLAYRLEQNGATVTAGDLSLLRMARYREQLRSERYQGILRQALAALHAGGVKVILLKGAALAHTVYPHATLRHCHDIDLLVAPSDLAQAATLLLAQEFRPHAQPTPHDFLAQATARGHLRLDHASGLPVELHTTLFRNNFYAMPLDDAGLNVWGNARPCPEPLAGLVLAPEWELVHILGTVICASIQARVTWVCDAHYLILANPTLDWERVGEIAGQSGLALATTVLLAYLRQEQQLPVPLEVFALLQRDCANAGRADVEQIWQSARNQGAVRYGDLWAAAVGWRERGLLLRWMLLPLPTTVNVQQGQNQQGQQVTGWQLPLFYFKRGVRYLPRKASAQKPSRE